MPQLKESELEVLRILWEQGPQKPAEIQEQFAWIIENGTLRSVLRGLVESGHATREKQGKAYFYRASASKRNMLSKMFRRMADVFTGGSPAELITQLVQAEKLSPDEIEQLRQIAQDEPKRPKKKQRK
ncbi:Penicillinase repressor [Symmachiella macrocystis]|uniref:Penicillinase repressor n=1 Tax=Symmachiella macrocystis TaxID=2527985 RepID=A0A5C6ATL3_9PLAN|nr:BlaI/MecI/CopY family transcriptional regulator [Symmachiella macrocystis]TWU03070.1 Penicillinase repressor [Symmachiella macrocystis]